jgi:hypothetical protein
MGAWGGFSTWSPLDTHYIVGYHMHTIVVFEAGCAAHRYSPSPPYNITQSLYLTQSLYRSQFLCSASLGTFGCFSSLSTLGTPLLRSQRQTPIGGAAQTRGRYSLWGQSMQFHPFLWFYGNGCCPSTLTYHLEHTLFPGVSYLHLSAVAPVVEQACQDHGLPYNKINGMADLRRRFKYQLEKHASSVW